MPQKNLRRVACPVALPSVQAKFDLLRFAPGGSSARGTFAATTVCAVLADPHRGRESRSSRNRHLCVTGCHGIMRSAVPCISSYKS